MNQKVQELLKRPELLFLSPYYKFKRYYLKLFFKKQLLNKQWIFIAGCNNSGTTLLNKILASHPQIASLPYEGQYISNKIYLPDTKNFGRLFSLCEREIIDNTNSLNPTDIIFDWATYLNNYKKPFCLEKSPTNIFKIDFLSLINPRGFIFIYRDPVAVCEGILRKRKIKTELKTAVDHWCSINKKVLVEYNKLNLPKVLISYERLCENPSATINLINKRFNLFNYQLNNQSFYKVHGKQSQIKNHNINSYKRLSTEQITFIANNAENILSQLEKLRLN